MKKSLFMFLFLMFAFSADAQIVKSIGIKGGISVANQEWKFQNADKESGKNIIGIYSVASLELFNSKVFSFVTDIGYCQKGSLTNESYVGVDAVFINGQLISGLHTETVSIRLHYLEYNALLKARLEKNHFIMYALSGLRLDSRLSVGGTSGFNSIKIAKHGQSYIYGITIGGGVEYKIKRFGINAEFQYHYDFTNVLDYSATISNQIKNKAYIINAGIKYYFQKKENSGIERTFSSIIRAVGIKGGTSVANQIWITDNSGIIISYGPGPMVSLSGFDANEKKNRIGYYSALSLEFFNSKVFSFVTDLAYCEKGAKYDFDYFIWDPNGPPNNAHYEQTTFTNSTVYLQFEPLIKSRVEIHHFNFYSLLGLRYDYLLSVYGNDYFTNIKNKGNIANKVITGLTVGSGMEYKINKIGIYTEVKYQHDFIYAVDYAPYEGGGSLYKIKNKAYIISAGIKYYFPEKENQQPNLYENKN